MGLIEPMTIMSAVSDGSMMMGSASGMAFMLVGVLIATVAGLLAALPRPPREPSPDLYLVRSLEVR